MALRLTCPGCRTEYELPNSDAGETVECECGARFVVAALADVSVEPERAAQTPSAPPPAAVPAPGAGSPVVLVCPGCGTRYELDATDLGAAFECECGAVFEATSPAPRQEGLSPALEEPAPSLEQSAMSSTPALESDAPVTVVPPIVGESPRSTPGRRVSVPRRKSSGNMLAFGVVGGVCVLAVLLAVRLQFGDPADGKSSPEDGGDVAADSSPNGSNGDDEEKASAAVDEQATPEDAPNTETVASSEAVGAAPTNGDAAASVPAVSAPSVAGSSNPNELTNRNEFVLGDGGPMLPPDVTPPGSAESQPDAIPDSPTPSEKRRSGDPSPVGTVVVEFVRPRDVRGELDAVVERALAEQRNLEKVTAEKGREGETWRKQLAVTGGWLSAANARLEPGTDAKTVARVRLLLARACLDAGRHLDAGILGWSVARTAPDDLFVEEKPRERKKKPPAPTPVTREPKCLGARIVAAETKTKPGAAPKADDVASLVEPGRSAGMIALAGLVAAYEAAPSTDRSAELYGIVRVADVLHERWPKHDQAAVVALHVGELLRTNDDPERAIAWYTRVPADAEQFARARLLAGQSTWSLVSSSEEPADWERAAKLLEQGVTAAAEDAALSDNVAVAKLTLARVRARQSRFDEVVELIATGSPSVVSTVSAEGPRPSRGVRSPAFARLVFSTLLEAQIRTGRLADAAASMEAVGGVADDDPALAIDLAKQLAEASSSSEADLASAITIGLAIGARHVDALPTPSLLAGAEAATVVADSLADGEERSRVLHAHAATFYEALLAKGLSNPASTRAVRFRLAAARTAAGDGQGAVEVYDDLLAEQPNVFAAQFDAANALLEWGRTDGDVEMLTAAIRGLDGKPHLWGFAKLSGVYRQRYDRNEKDEDRERFVECRVGIARARREVAERSEGERRTAELEAAVREIDALVRQFQRREGSAWAELEEMGRDLRSRLEGER